MVRICGVLEAPGAVNCSLPDAVTLTVTGVDPPGASAPLEGVTTAAPLAGAADQIMLTPPVLDNVTVTGVGAAQVPLLIAAGAMAMVAGRGVGVAVGGRGVLVGRGVAVRVAVRVAVGVAVGKTNGVSVGSAVGVGRVSEALAARLSSKVAPPA